MVEDQQTRPPVRERLTAVTAQEWRVVAQVDGAEELLVTYAPEAIAFALRHFRGRIAMVSSFGAESAVLLHIHSEVDRAAPVVFVDTGRLFAETLEYRNQLVGRLGLTDVRTVAPEHERIATLDPHRALWMTKPDLCCQIRKTEPLARALQGFDAWFTGRKRFQSSTRANIPLFEADGGRIKVNPIASWPPERLAAYTADNELPPHPLVARGYPSIGCQPCTSKVKPGEDPRAGRWPLTAAAARTAT